MMGQLARTGAKRTRNSDAGGGALSKESCATRSCVGKSRSQPLASHRSYSYRREPGVVRCPMKSAMFDQRFDGR
jgi:hypothetical protein